MGTRHCSHCHRLCLPIDLLKRITSTCTASPRRRPGLLDWKPCLQASLDSTCKCRIVGLLPRSLSRDETSRHFKMFEDKKLKFLPSDSVRNTAWAACISRNVDDAGHTSVPFKEISRQSPPSLRPLQLPLQLLWPVHRPAMSHPCINTNKFHQTHPDHHLILLIQASWVCFLSGLSFNMASNVLSLAESPLAAGPCGSGICCLLRRCLCRSCRITGCCRSCLPSRWSWLKYTPGAKMQSACHSWGLRFFVSEGNSFLSIKLLQLSGNASAASSLDNPALTAAWPGDSWDPKRQQQWEERDGWDGLVAP